MKNKHCQWCDHSFESDISYQIYCSVECREQATREKISARYNHTRRVRRKGKARPCKSCEKQLSIYNDGDLCENCLADPRDVKGALRDIRRLQNGKE